MDHIKTVGQFSKGTKEQDAPATLFNKNLTANCRNREPEAANKYISYAYKSYILEFGEVSGQRSLSTGPENPNLMT